MLQKHSKNVNKKLNFCFELNVKTSFKSFLVRLILITHANRFLTFIKVLIYLVHIMQNKYLLKKR